MHSRSQTRPTARPLLQRNSLTLARGSARANVPQGKRARAVEQNDKAPFIPPETWHEPSEEPTGDYRIVVQPAGRGYRHVVTPEEIRERLAKLPPEMIAPLEVVQMSRMTRKKQSFPCYGMQWGTALYLYPIEEALVEYFHRAPKPCFFNEVRMYGGEWVQRQGTAWQLRWSLESIRDFYLNNILIHELGHLLDNRNSNYVDRERFAEWFAIEHGYRASRPQELARRGANAVRRHHRR